MPLVIRHLHHHPHPSSPRPAVAHPREAIVSFELARDADPIIVPVATGKSVRKP